MPAVLRRATRIALDLLYPPECALCGRGGTLICDRCAAALPATDGRRCARCWVPVAGAALCRHCSEAPPAFSSLRAAFVMEVGARDLAHMLKYEGLTSLAEPMADLLGQRAGAQAAGIVVPVPLHGGRERSRGYNQAALLAQHVAARAGLPCEARALRRVRATPPLAKAMGRDERLTIMRGAFSARAERVEGRAVLVVDDVVTTGATLDACAQALLAAGARDVRCVTWARAD